MPLPTRWRMLFGWGLVNILGFGFVGALFHNFPLAYAFSPSLTHFGAFDGGAALFGFLLGFVPALFIGLMQWWLLCRLWPLSRWWIVTVSAGIGLQHFLADGFPSARDLSLAVLAGSLVTAGWQGWLVRQAGASATKWFGSVLLGWCGGWVSGLLLLNALDLLHRPWQPGLDFQQHGLLGLVLGAAYSLGTALLIYRRMMSPTV